MAASFLLRRMSLDDGGGLETSQNKKQTTNKQTTNKTKTKKDEHGSNYKWEKKSLKDKQQI